MTHRTPAHNLALSFLKGMNGMTPVEVAISINGDGRNTEYRINEHQFAAFMSGTVLSVTPHSRPAGLAKVLAAAQAAANMANSDSNDGELEALRDALDEALAALGLAMPDAADDPDGYYCTRCGSPDSAPDPTCGECPDTDRVPCQVDNSCTYIAEDEDDLEKHITTDHPNIPECEECGTREDAELIHGKVFCPSCLHNAERSGWTGQEN